MANLNLIQGIRELLDFIFIYEFAYVRFSQRNFRYYVAQTVFYLARNYTP